MRPKVAALQTMGPRFYQAVNSRVRSTLTAVLAATTLAAIFPLSVVAQPRTLKIFIAVDMEGIAGVVTGDQLTPKGFEYERFRQFMTAEALAAVNAARKSGASEIVVRDAHFEGENLLIEQ